MMPITDSHVPYSEHMIQGMAKSLGVNVAQLWVNPVTGAFSLRDGASNAILSVEEKLEVTQTVSEDET